MYIEFLHTLAQYNRWANQRLYETCEKIGEEEYSRPRQAFFGSIHGTLNHLLLTDRNWIGRVDGNDPRLGPLDKILFETFDRLRVARVEEDQHILDVVSAIDEKRLETDLTYCNTKGKTFTTPLRMVLGNIFNHQVHHRGQVHDMLSQTEVPPPPLDFLHFVRESL